MASLAPSSDSRIKFSSNLFGRAWAFARSFLLLLPTFHFAHALTLTVAVDSDSPSTTFSAFEGSSTLGCDFTLFAASSARELASVRAGRNVIARTKGSGGAIVLKAKKLPELRSSLGSPFRGKVSYQGFFRATLLCNGVKASSQVVSARFPTSTSGTDVESWIRALKRNVEPSDFQIVPAFSGLTFDKPLDVRAANDGSGRIFVIEQGGIVWSVTSSGMKEKLLDLTSRTQASGERGLLGLAVHPRFRENGYIFVNYIRFPEEDTFISRFTVSPGTSFAALESEAVLFAVDQTTPIHKGGALAFGPDGFLYIGLGDGGPSGDPKRNAQNLNTFLGKVLRIDVDSTEAGKPYGIPVTNPLRGSPGLPEIYAFGFRNPYRFSFDSLSGKLWLGDVGQDRLEEIDIVEAGRNYGWNVVEGSRCYPSGSKCSLRGLSGPTIKYSHLEGFSVTGGFVYRGSALPSLTGRYIFGDFVTGTVWSADSRKVKPVKSVLFDTEHFISGFGIDQDQELLLVSYGEGVVYRLAPLPNGN